MNRVAALILTASLLIGSSLANGGSALEEGLIGFAKDRRLRENWSPVQTFYIAECGDPAFKWYVYWPEERSLLLISDVGNEDHFKQNLIDVTKWIHLDELVNTETEIGSSNYLVTEEWAAHRIRCALQGKRLVAEISIPGRAKHAYKAK